MKMTKVEMVNYLKSKKVPFRFVMTGQGEKLGVMFGDLEHTFSFEGFRNEEEVYETIVFPWQIIHNETSKNRLAEQILNFEYAKKKLRVRLIHEILGDMLCRKCYDFYEEVYMEVGILSIRLKKTILNEYGVSEEEIFEIAEKNMQTFPKTCLDIKKLIGEESRSHSPEEYR